MNTQKKQLRSMADVTTFDCAVGDCSSNYKTVGGLRTHQKKKHNEVYLKNGIQMRKRVKVTETTNAEIATFGAPMMLPSKEKEESNNESSTTSSGMQRLERIIQDVQSDFSSLLAQMLELQEQSRLLAKKTTKWCVVCFEKENDYAFLPCGHKCVCRGCAEMQFRSATICPICRNQITTIQHIYDISTWNE